MEIRILSVGYAGKMACRIQYTVLVPEAFSADFSVFLIFKRGVEVGGSSDAVHPFCHCVKAPNTGFMESQRRGIGDRFLYRQYSSSKFASRQ
jgi:hypothetical protein